MLNKSRKEKVKNMETLGQRMIREFKEKERAHKDKAKELGLEIEYNELKGYTTIYKGKTFTSVKIERLVEMISYHIEQENTLKTELNTLLKDYNKNTDMLVVENVGMELERLNGLSCRIRTAFINDNNDLIYLELTSDIKNNLSISFLFELDNWFGIDRNVAQSEKLRAIEKDYFENKRAYTKENIVKLVNELGLSITDICFSDNYYVFDKVKDFKVFKYHLGN